MSAEPEALFTNYYECPKCGATWQSDDDCQPDDDCGECGCRHVSPYQSDDLSDDEDNDNLHEGCECALCDDLITDETDGESTPQGSMHKQCAAQHEAENPEEW